ncbi:MAG: hypothetical protein J6X24_01425 [Firmicutes bacterium]|nr:hypothetical protein [Bacillota bacterium]
MSKIYGIDLGTRALKIYKKNDGVIYDVTCPNCGNEISFDEETLEVGSITCPQCGELLEFDLGSGEDE